MLLALGQSAPIWLFHGVLEGNGSIHMESPLRSEIASTADAVAFEQAVIRAVHWLSRGDVVALPTETVYGLAACAFDGKAIERVFQVKGRPSTNPLIVHVAEQGMIGDCAAQWPASAATLARYFWPGPLTMVVPKRPEVPDAVTAGLDSVALRWPGHPFMQAVIRRLGRPLAAPSANLSNRLSPTTAQQVDSQLGGKIPLIVDGGACSVGIESTVVDLTGVTPRILRPGVIHLGALAAVLPTIQTRDTESTLGPDQAQRSPGQLARHYCPQSPLRVMGWTSEDALTQEIQRQGLEPKDVCVLCHEVLPAQSSWMRVSIIPNDPEAYARALYAELHQSDQLAPKMILVEAPPDSAPWDGVRDRLQRASGVA